MEYKNFFENQKEAHMRLNGTVVLYDGNPVQILCVTDHIGDGHMRAYIREIGDTTEEFKARPQPNVHTLVAGGDLAGAYMDEFMSKNPSSGIQRKHLSSPLFNKFRPFELGMYWEPPYVNYVERQPNRRVEQGLIHGMLVTRRLSPAGSDAGYAVDLFGPEMKRCILGEHPSANRCMQAITDDKLDCRAAAFHRHFALVKGPIDTLFLAYKSNVIGQLPNADYSKVRLGQKYRYCKEAVDELHLFNTIM